jgi:hypothetical protein
MYLLLTTSLLLRAKEGVDYCVMVGSSHRSQPIALNLYASSQTFTHLTMDFINLFTNDDLYLPPG